MLYLCKMLDGGDGLRPEMVNEIVSNIKSILQRECRNIGYENNDINFDVIYFILKGWCHNF